MPQKENKKVKLAAIRPAKVCLIVMWTLIAVSLAIGLVILFAFNNKELAAVFLRLQ